MEFDAESIFEVEKSTRKINYFQRLRAYIGRDVTEIIANEGSEKLTLEAPAHFMHGRYNTCTALAHIPAGYYNAPTVQAPARRIIPNRPKSKRRSYGAS